VFDVESGIRVGQIGRVDYASGRVEFTSVIYAISSAYTNLIVYAAPAYNDLKSFANNILILDTNVASPKNGVTIIEE
jgi:hypothetical protein